MLNLVEADISLKQPGYQLKMVPASRGGARLIDLASDADRRKTTH